MTSDMTVETVTAITEPMISSLFPHRRGVEGEKHEQSLTILYVWMVEPNTIGNVCSIGILLDVFFSRSWSCYSQYFLLVALNLGKL